MCVCVCACVRAAKLIEDARLHPGVWARVNRQAKAVYYSEVSVRENDRGRMCDRGQSLG